jgi:hypothetical protein
MRLKINRPINEAKRRSALSRKHRVEKSLRLACGIIKNATSCGREDPYHRWADECLAEGGIVEYRKFRRLTIE